MTTPKSPESLPTRSEIRSDSLPLPILDLINIQTLAEDIAEEPAGRDAKKLARQIIEDCAESLDLADVRDMAEQIRATSDAFVREALALQIAEQIEALLTSAETETMKRVKITTRKILSDDLSTKGDRRIDAIDTKTGETVVSAYYKSWDK